MDVRIVGIFLLIPAAYVLLLIFWAWALLKTDPAGARDTAAYHRAAVILATVTLMAIAGLVLILI